MAWQSILIKYGPFVVLAALLGWIVYRKFFVISKSYLAQFMDFDNPEVADFGMKIFFPQWIPKDARIIIANHILVCSEKCWDALRRSYGKGKPFNKACKKLELYISPILGFFPDPRYNKVAGLTVTKNNTTIALRYEKLNNGKVRIAKLKPYLPPLAWEIKNVYDYHYSVFKHLDEKPKNWNELSKIQQGFFFTYDKDVYEPPEVLKKVEEEYNWKRSLM